MPVLWPAQHAQGVVPRPSASHRMASELRRPKAQLKSNKKSGGYPVQAYDHWALKEQRASPNTALWRHGDEVVIAMIAAPPPQRQQQGSGRRVVGNPRAVGSGVVPLPAVGRGNAKRESADVMESIEEALTPVSPASPPGASNMAVVPHDEVHVHWSARADSIVDLGTISSQLQASSEISSRPSQSPKAPVSILARSPPAQRQLQLFQHKDSLLKAEPSPHTLRTPRLIWGSSRMSPTAPFHPPRAPVAGAASPLSRSLLLRSQAALAALSLELAQEEVQDVTARLRSYLHLPGYLTDPFRPENSFSGVEAPRASIAAPPAPSPRGGSIFFKGFSRPTLGTIDLSDAALGDTLPSPASNSAHLPIDARHWVSPTMRTARGSIHHTPKKPRSSAFFERTTTNSGTEGLADTSQATADADLNTNVAGAFKRHQTLEFDICLSISKQYRVPIEEVREKHVEFVKLDDNGNGELCKGEFEDVIRHHCNIPTGEELPPHLAHNLWAHADANNSGAVDFEEYFLWALSHEYKEEWLVQDTIEISIRKIARENNFNLVDVEAVRLVFEAFDEDKSGFIEEGEFKYCLFKLLGARQPTDISQNMLKRYWLEVDSDGSGSISLEEFIIWYLTYIRPV